MIAELPALSLEVLLTLLAGPPPSMFDEVICQMNNLAHVGNRVRNVAAVQIMIRNRRR